ncbi:ABC transporter substrate-binding protein [Streptomyces sp. Ac-502]|uniref:ABC transporter substrate-binding protein n=1 Tax=Streptomyces sp. Ac-502 TaxID=3342801 RepID=UPI0038626058
MGRKTLACALVVTVALAVAGCGGVGAPSGETATAPSDPNDVSGHLTVLTHRTDLVQNGVLKRYAAEFHQTYPKVEVEFEGITDYEGEVRIRMNTEDYGDVLMIPSSIAKDNYPKFLAPLGSTAAMSKQYRFTGRSDVGGKTYGIATFGSANGVAYNKTVWKKAGVTEWPTSPAEFIAALRTVKARTGVVPYYTNFKDGWPLGTPWSNSVGSVSCSARAGDALATSARPWSPGSDLSVIDALLYDIVRGGLAEKDPTTTNWENSKNLLAKGQVGSMVLGSWAVSQLRDAAEQAGTNPDDIGFMPFPAQKDGKFCAMLLSDYQQAVNVHSPHKEAARAWLDWFTEKSGYAQSQGAVSALRSAPLPSNLQPYVDNDVKLVERSEARTAGVNAVDDASEIGLAKPDYRQKIVDLARGAQPGDLRGYFAELDRRWAEASRSIRP